MLHSLFGFVEVLSLEFQTTGHVSLDLVAGRDTSRGLLLGSIRFAACSFLLLLLYPPLLPRLELVTRYAGTELGVILAAVLRQGKARAVQVGVDVVIADLILLAVAAYVIRNVCP